MGNDKICKGNEIITGMNVDEIHDWKSYGNNLVIILSLYDIYIYIYIYISTVSYQSLIESSLSLIVDQIKY